MDEEYSTWYILLIIITVVSFILTIILSLLFVYFPGQRAASKFDDLFQRGSDFVSNSQETADNVILTADTLTDFSIALCKGIKDNNGDLLTLINNSGDLDEFCENFS